MDRVNSESTPMSKKLAACSLLADGYWNRIHHAADDWGVFPAEAEILKGRCWPYRPDVTLDMIRGWLEEYRKRDLVYLWTDEKGNRWGFFVGWFDHNPIRFLGKNKYPQPSCFRFEISTKAKDKDRPGAKDIKVIDLRGNSKNSRTVSDSVGHLRTEVEVEVKAKDKKVFKEGLSTVSTAKGSPRHIKTFEPLVNLFSRFKPPSKA